MTEAGSPAEVLIWDEGGIFLLHDTYKPKDK